MRQQTQCFYEFGPFRIDATKRLLQRAGEVVPLTSKTFDMLLALIESAGEVVEKDELMRRVWPDSFVEEVNLAYHISLLRKALGESRNEHHYIVTISGQGYRFVAEVKELQDERAESVVQQSTRAGLTIEEEVETNAHEEAQAQAGIDTGGRQPEEEKATRAQANAGGLDSEITRRKRGVRLALMTFIVLAGGTASLYKLTGLKKPTAPPLLNMTRLTATGKAYSPAISPDGKYVAYINSEAEGTSLWIRQMSTESNVQVIPPSKASYQGLTFSPDGNHLYYALNEPGERNLALYQITAPLGGVARKLIANVDKTFSLSPDARRVTFVRNEQDLIVANLDGSGERKLATRQRPDFFYSAAWSPDGKKIACLGWSKSTEADVVEVEIEGGAQKTITQHWSWIQQVAWLPDGSGLVLGASDKQGSGLQLWQLSYPGGEIRRITTDLNSYSTLSLTADARALVATQNQQVFNLWVMPVGEQERAKQITASSEKEGWSGVAWTPAGKIVYSSFASGKPEIWIMDADGSHQQQLTFDLGSDRSGLSVSPDGRYIAFVSSRAGDMHIWRIDIDGGNPKQLTSTHGLYPFFSPDSKWVFYRANGVWKLPIDGGEPVQLTGPYSDVIDISPDGKLIAYFLAGNRRKFGIISAEGGEPLRIFERLPSTDRKPEIRWTPDGHALSYLVERNGVSNVWLQPIDGSPPKPVTDFKADQIWNFAWSRDGKYLACARGSGTRDVVMISHFR